MERGGGKAVADQAERGVSSWSWGVDWSCPRVVPGDRCSGEPLGQRGLQFRAPDAGQGAQANGRNVTTAVALDARRDALQIDLVQHADLRHVGRADLLEHRVDGRDLVVALVRRAVDHVQDQVGVGGLGQRRPERGDEVVRQVADEAHGVGEDDRRRVRHVDLAQRRVERREQLVGGERRGAGQAVEQRRLARVRVADDARPCGRRRAAACGSARRGSARRGRCGRAAASPARRSGGGRSRAASRPGRAGRCRPSGARGGSSRRPGASRGARAAPARPAACPRRCARAARRCRG